ncbi:hypothetical protein D3C85_1553290 [compost metagenome]
MRSTWPGAISGASSTRMRPLLVSITSRFSAGTARHSFAVTGARGAAAGAASCAEVAPAASIRTDAAAQLIETRILAPLLKSMPSRP